MVWTASQAIQSLVEKPIITLAVFGITHGRNDHDKFGWWQFSMIESILTVSLLQYFLGLQCFGAEKTNGAIFDYRGIALRLGPIAVLMIAEHHNARFGSVRFAIFVWFNHQDTHRREGLTDLATVFKV